jgi:UDP-glucose 4-epimerase
MVKLLSDFRPDKVIHFAGQKSVNESVNNPKFYHEQNVGGTKTLLSALAVCECDNIIFSSSAAVYGKTEALPINEMHQPCPANPYGETKLAAEKAIFKWVGESAGRSSVLLRYFNPVGAHSSGKIGENPSGPPSNLFPSIMRVAAGIWPDLEIYGDDYDTPDGTALRDYVHITDLVSGHLAALEFSQNNLGTNIFNLGTGKAKSVLEILRAFESATGQIIPFKIKARRPGDTAFCCADPSRARKHLKWSSKKSLSEMCRDAWRWQLHSMN